MKMKLLGTTGVQISSLCFGTMTFGAQADRLESAKLFKKAIDAGINFFDCANVYSRGTAENILGELVSGMRDDLVITSKVYNRMSDKPNDCGSSRRHITRAVEESLHRLKTDRIDIYFLHGWDCNVSLEETVSVMDSLVHAGKIIYWGISNFSAWQIQKALRAAEQNGLEPPRVIQPMYNLLKRQAEVEILPMAQAEKLGVITYSPLGGGYLTGKYLDSSNTKGRLFENEKYTQRYENPRYRREAKAFCMFAQKNKLNPASLAVAWVMNHPAVTCPIIGARSVEQLIPSLAAGDLVLNEKLYSRISSLSETPPPATDRSELGG
ncbi:MAG: aldo/keto reductase [Spirochaetaceae bacterium]|nr:MAG: aldo/keto reductase [Spirochaetaceae bacterium]